MPRFEMLVQIARQKPISALAAVLLMFASLPGCSRFGVRHSPRQGQAAEEPLSVSVEVFQTQKAKDRNRPRADGVVTSLLYHKAGRWQVVGRSARSQWNVGKLVPGRYRLAVAGMVTEGGELEPIKGPRTRDFELKDGQAAYADVVVKRTPTAVKVLIAVTIIVVVILVILAALNGDDDSGDVDLGDILEPIAAIPRLIITYPDVWLQALASLPTPPPPPPPEFRDEEWKDEAFEPPPDRPAIRGYAPSDSASGVRPDADIRIRFDRPMSGWTLSPNTLYVEGSKSGEVTRGVDYLEKERAVVIDPLRTFVPGETVTVTIYGESIASEEGEVLGDNYRFSFQVAPAAAAPAPTPTAVH
jgi:Big-like domain-containing protein